MRHCRDYDPSDYDDDRGYSCAPDCTDCLEKQNDLDTAKEFFGSALAILYGNAGMDLSKLESVLEEVCAVLNVPMPMNDLNLTRLIK